MELANIRYIADEKSVFMRRFALALYYARNGKAFWIPGLVGSYDGRKNT